MAREVAFKDPLGADRRCSDAVEMARIVRQLTSPGMSLITDLVGWGGYLDFSVLDDHRLEMELFENHDDFGILDSETAARVIEIAMTDERELPLREKLHGLEIEWLT
jgi:hypothetical protein